LNYRAALQRQQGKDQHCQNSHVQIPLD
jgi:hypothetical protein